ncbi:MAG: FHA domain-containing protein [Planctomycetota bacterium]|nr:MAG: FHA domain-containing protein [Planctomycetota bacterium]
MDLDRIPVSVLTPFLLLAVEVGGRRRLLRIPGPPLEIGRSGDCGLAVNDAAVSRRHCRIQAVGDGIEIRDLGSANGTFLAGERIERARLRVGDEIRIGGARIEILSLPAPGKALDSSGDPWLGRELHGCRILERVGRGGAAVVYRARQLSLGRDVAVKVLRPAGAARPEAVAAFLREARAAASLAHPNLVQVHDLGQEDGRPYSIMEYLPGGSLAEELRRRGALPWREAAAVGLACARALEHAHGRGLLHHDVKPGNLLRTADGTVKLADLGLVGLPGEAASAPRAGSPHYMAPERILRRPVDARSDLYSLGCTLFALLSGEHPFERDGVKAILRAHCVEPPPRLAPGPGMPDRLAALVDRLLRKDPAERPASAASVAAELEGLLGAPGPVHTGPRPSAGAAHRRHRRRNRWKVALGVVSTLVIVAFALRGHQLLLEWGEGLRRLAAAPAAASRPSSPAPAPVSAAATEPATEPATGPAAALPAAEEARAERAAPERPPRPEGGDLAAVQEAVAALLDPAAAGLTPDEAEDGVLGFGRLAVVVLLDELTAVNWSQPGAVRRAEALHRALIQLEPDVAERVFQAAGAWLPPPARTGATFSRIAGHDRGIAAAWHAELLGSVPPALR